MSWWSKFWDWLSGGIGAIIAAVAIIAVTAVANVFTGGALTPILMGEIFGAIGGATGAAATGGDIGRGMLIGTITGGFTGGILGPPGSGGGYFVQQAAAYGEVVAPTFAHISGSMLEGLAASSVITSGVGAGSAVINGMVSNAYAAGSKAANYAAGDGPRLSIGFSGIRAYGAYTYANHVGIQISGTDNYDISAGFNPRDGVDSNVLMGKPVPGKVTLGERYAFTLTINRDPVFIQKVFANIMQSYKKPPKYDFHAMGDGKHYECYDWVAEMLGN